MGHDAQADQANQDTEDIDPIHSFVEECYARRDRENRSRGDDQGAVGRRLGQLDTVGFADKIDKRLTESEQQEFREIFLPNPDAVPHRKVQQHKDDTGDQRADAHDIHDRYPQPEQLVRPDVGHSP